MGMQSGSGASSTHAPGSLSMNHLACTTWHIAPQKRNTYLGDNCWTRGLDMCAKWDTRCVQKETQGCAA